MIQTFAQLLREALYLITYLTSRFFSALSPSERRGEDGDVSIRSVRAKGFEFRIVEGRKGPSRGRREEDSMQKDLIHAIFKLVWDRRALQCEKNEGTETLEGETGAGTSKKSRPTFANANALKLSCELLQVFIAEATECAATVAEAEGVSKIEPTHLERILPQLRLDF
ncbi:protein MHF2 homolog [Actinidia eriantha]|uniref:protein MHF2 homolog n=1 Tax=Actinidia eriantha TaxID=165200 RepID=UPI00258D4B97|nr:protein MHF2 homolog [Actinidia eriantha]